MKGAAAVTEILKRERVECLFFFPGNPIIDPAAVAGIRPYMARTERTAVGMADGYTRVTNGRLIGVCASQLGPGVENSFGGVAQAYSDSSPILFLPAGVRRNRLWSQPAFDAALNYQHITKWAARVEFVERIPELMRRAFTYLRTGRPGPVLLELPADVMEIELPDDALVYEEVKGAKSVAADPESVAAAVRVLVGAKVPLIHAGLGVLYAGAWDELRELAELLQAPVMTTLTGKSAFPEDHPLSIGSGGMTWPLTVARFLAESDVIFGVGSSLSTSTFAAPIPKGKTAIQLSVDERDMNKDYATRHLLLGDAKFVLRQMIEEVHQQLGAEGRKGDERMARQIKGIKDEWLATWMPKLTSNEVPINPYRVLWELQQTLDLRNTVATHDSGNPRDQMSPFWKALEPNSYIGWGKSTHLGYGLPLALGAKVAKPEKTVINVMGDAAFGMSGLDIETAARNHIGILTIVLNNSCLGDYERILPNATRLYGTRFLSGDYTKVAEGLGAYAERVEKPEEIVPALRRALKVTQEHRPALLEMITKEEIQFSKY